MKKILLTFLVLFCTITGYAQIKLEHTFDCGKGSKFNFRLPYCESVVEVGGKSGLWGNIIVVIDQSGNTQILDLDTYKDYVYELPQYSRIVLTAKGFFTGDDRICFVVEKENINTPLGDEYHHYYIYDINHKVIQDLGIGYSVSCGIIRLGEGQCKFYICRHHRDSKCEFAIYSLPGNGITTDMDVMPDSHHSSVRKYFHNDQVLIESDDSTYNLQGKQVY